MKTTFLMVFLLTGILPAFSQQEGAQTALTGNLRWDLFSRLETGAGGIGETPARRKSPLRAAAFSAVLPGAGEFYTESYWRSLAFFGAEVALWVVYATYDSRGDRQTAEFERYADQHWSVVRYAQWMEAYYDELTTPGAPPCPTMITGSSGEPWERVDWRAINTCEEIIGRNAGTGFSHRLPARPDQQYYELIGKYHQYNPGWDDSNVTPATLALISARFAEYRDMRGRANDFYHIASTASFLLVANHVLSALDAAWSAAQFNSAVQVEAHLQPTVRPFGFVEFVPTARARISF